MHLLPTTADKFLRVSLKKKGLALALTAAVATASPWIATAMFVNPAASAQTSLTLVSTLITNQGGAQSAEVGHLAGFGTTDPAKHSLSENLARVSAQMLKADGLLPFDCQDLNGNCLETQASGLGDHSDTALLVDVGALGQPTLATGVLGLGIRQATVDEESAAANLAAVTADTNVADGLVILEGIAIGTTHDEATASSAVAETGMTIARIELLPIDKLLSMIGQSVDDLSASSLLELGGTLLPPGSTDSLTAAIQAFEQTDVETDQDQAMLDAAVAELTDGDLDLIADAAATVQILSLATKYGESCLGDILDCATLIALAIQTAKAAALDQLELVRGALALTIGELPLITFEDISIEASAQANEAGAVPAASIQWGTATVAGIALPSGWTLQSLGAALDAASSAIGDAIGGGLGLSLDMPQPTTSSGMDGDYRVSSASITALSVVFMSELAPGTSFSAQLLSMTADAEFRPGVADEGDPVCCASPVQEPAGQESPGSPTDTSSVPMLGLIPDPGPEPGSPLAKTGAPSMAPLGVAMLWGAVSLMWWLRFTAKPRR